MAVARSSRATASILRRVANVCAAHIAPSTAVHRSSNLHLHLLLPASLSPPVVRPFSTFPAQAWRSSTTRCTAPCGMSSIARISSATEEVVSLPSICVRTYSKRPKKWQGVPHAFIQVEPGAPCPPYSPNAGSVKKRKHNKRMAQRHAFVKAQAHQRKEETKAALIKRDAARRKRWREAAARTRAWEKHLQEKQITPAIVA